MAEARYISFHSDGSCAGVGPSGTYPFTFESMLLLRYELVDGEVRDRYVGLNDEEALAQVEQDTREAGEAAALKARDEAASRPYTIFKTTVIERLTDKELDTFDEVYRAQPLRGRMMWDNCVSIVSTDEYFGLLTQLFTKSFTKKRAAEILAPIT